VDTSKNGYSKCGSARMKRDHGRHQFKTGEHPVHEDATCAPRRRFPGPTIYWSTKHLVCDAVHVPGRRQTRGWCTAPNDRDHHCRRLQEAFSKGCWNTWVTLAPPPGAPPPPPPPRHPPPLPLARPIFSLQYTSVSECASTGCGVCRQAEYRATELGPATAWGLRQPEFGGLLALLTVTRGQSPLRHLVTSPQS
jgi:hypothetical protein